MPILSSSDNQIGILIKAESDLKGVDDAEKSLSRLDNQSDSSSKAASALGTAGKFAAVGIAAAGAAAIIAGKSALSSAGDYEQSRIAFETMLGSADKARKLMTDIANFAKSTPFELPEVVNGSKQLLAFGYAQEQIIPTMRKIGDIAAGVGVPVGQLTTIFGQVKVAGRLMGGDLLQFTNAGVPMIEALAAVMKKPQSAIKDLIEKGKVGFPEVEKALDHLTNKGSKFGGMMDKQSHSFQGVVSNIQDGFGQMMRNAMGITVTGDIIQGSFFDKIKNGALAAMPAMQKMADGIAPVAAKMAGALGEVGNVIGAIAKQAAEYLSPKFVALKNTIEQQIVPILITLKPYLEDLAKILGVTIVVALGLAVDAINIILNVAGWLFKALQDGNPIIVGLAGVFGALAASMAFNAVFNALTIGFETLRLVTIPQLGAEVTWLKNLISSPTVFGAIAIGAALIAFQMIQDAANKARQAIDDSQKAADNAVQSNQAVIKRLNDLAKNGNAEQKARAKESLQNLAKAGSFSSGGFTGTGGKYDVAGVVHKGEYVVPKDQVDQSTGLPKVTNNRSVSIGTVIVQNESAGRGFWDGIDQDAMLVSNGLTPQRGF